MHSLPALLLLTLHLLLSACHAHAPAPAPCISTPEANQLLTEFVSLLSNISVPLAERILTPTFTQKSVSLNFIFGLPPNATTSPNRTAFITSQQQQQQGGGGAVNESFTILDSIHDCARIWFHWSDHKLPLPFTGFDEMFLAHDPAHGWRIDQDLSEFNSAAVLVDSGAFPCNASA